MATIFLDHKAANVCAYCRVRKQKCDRSLPQCSRCAAKGRECDYTPVADIRQQDPEPLFVEQGTCGPDLSYRGREELLHAVDEWMSGVPGSWNKFLELVHEILDLAEVNIPSMVETFTMGIQRWMPVVNPDEIAPDAKIPPLLLLSIFLVTRKPCGHGEHVKRGVLYETVKQMVVLLQGLEDTYIEFVQAGILLAMYEVGHGNSRRAHLTLSTCISMLNLQGPILQNGVWELDNTPLRIRVAVLILDRLIPLCTPTQSLLPLLCPPSHSIAKHVSEELEAASPIPPLSHDPAKKPSRKLQIQAQVALGTGRALQYIYAIQNGHNHESYDEVEAVATSVVQLMVGKQEGHSWFMCDSVALSFSALILLHQSRITHPPEVETDVQEMKMRTQVALKYSRRMAWDMCAVTIVKLNREPNMETLPFLGLVCVWKIGVVVAETSGLGGIGERGGVFWDVDLDEDLGEQETGSGDVKELVPVLRRFEERWGVGGIFRTRIEDASMRDVWMDLNF